MTGRTAFAAALALLLILPAAARGADPVTPPAPVAVAAGAPQALAVQPATSGTLTRVGGGARRYDLVLHGVSPTLEAFDDSPGVRTQRVRLMTLFDALFGPGVPPKNAAVSVGRRTMAVTLLSGRYDARRQTVRYRVRALRGARPLPRRLAGPTLFIDDFGGWSCHGNVNNSTPYALTPTDWEDPGSSQRMTSDPGYAASNTATDWESSGVFLGTGCAVGVLFRSDDPGLTVGFAVVQAVSIFSFDGFPFPVPLGDGATCFLSGEHAYRYRCDRLWNRTSGMTRDASWQLLPA